MFDLWREPRVCEYAGEALDTHGQAIALPVESRDDSDRLLQFWLDRARGSSGFRWAVLLRSDNAFVGAVGFNSVGPAAEFAYHFVPSYWGRGLATEASRAAIEWAFSHGASSITCNIEPENSRSIRLASALRFAPTSTQEGGAQVYSLARDTHAA
jgi:RimJ/RimL family protein N-acetyltransferase